MQSCVGVTGVQDLPRARIHHHCSIRCRCRLFWSDRNQPDCERQTLYGTFAQPYRALENCLP